MAVKSLTYTTARTLKTMLRNPATGFVWNTTLASGAGAYEAYNASNIAQYGIATPEVTPPGTYEWVAPAALPASATGVEYVATTYDCAAGTLATTDLPLVVREFTSAFDGTNWTTGAAATASEPVEFRVEGTSTSATDQ